MEGSRGVRRAVRVLAAVLTAACIPASGQAVPSDPFPTFEGLTSNVEFWKNVFSTWTLGQFVLHDNEHLALVYEVVNVPGPVGEVLTHAQREFVRGRERQLELRLRTLESKVRTGSELTDEEKTLAVQIATTAGTDSVTGAAARARAQRGLRERFRRGLEISARYDAAFREVFRQAGLPEDLAFLPHVESSFQPTARSSAGAVGVWQFTRPAARKFMLMSAGIDERLDPILAARGAARYLRDAYDQLGDWALALTAYNHGVDGMLSAKERFGTDFERIVREHNGRYFGFASRNFYAEFLAARAIASNPSAFFPEPLSPEPPFSLESAVLEHSMPPLQVARAHGVPLDDLAAINPAWTRRAVRGGYPLAAGSTVWLPPGRISRAAGDRQPSPTPMPVAPEGRTATSPPPPAPSDARTAGEGTAEFLVHVVRKGETLFRIARTYGISLGELLDLNKLSEDAPIHPGQRLRIPVQR
jgi:membrane-bound lytic murein transglycosylase D